MIDEFNDPGNEDLFEKPSDPFDVPLPTEDEPQGPTSDQEELGESGISVGLTPVGIIGVNVRDADGSVASHFIDDPAEAWQLAGHFQSLATMMVQARYAMAFKEQQMIAEMMKKQNIFVPGQ